MKKLMALLAGVVLAGTLAQAQVVTSRNAVGYVKVDLLQTALVQRLYLLRNDFVGLTGPMTIENTISNQVPANSQIIFWNDALQGYPAPITRGPLNWGVPGSNQLPRGAAFFIRLPTIATPTNRTVYFMGEVPDSTTAPFTTNTVVPGLNLDGYAYPVSQLWTNTTYAKKMPPNTQLIIWNVTNQAYLAPLTRGPLSWPVSASNLVIQPAQGFFIRTTVLTNIVVTEPKPYSWP